MKPAFMRWAMEGREDTGLTFEKYSSIHSREYEKLIVEAAKDPYLGEFVLHRKREAFMGFFEHGELVGFAVPRRDSDGHYRTGAIFVTASHRSKGIAKAFVKQYFDGKKGRAYIEPGNQASIALYASVGFKKTGKQITDDDEVLEEYVKD